MAIAARFNLRISQLDIETAYLNGKMDTVVHMEEPELLEKMLRRIVSEDADPDLTQQANSMLKEMKGTPKICKLNKAIYGLRQAGRQWYTTLDSTFREIGLTPCNADPCVYVDKEKLTYVLVYVDDILIISNNRRRENQIKTMLSKEFKIKDLDEGRYCLDLEISQDQNSITLSQTRYNKDILKKFGMSNCNCNPLALQLLQDQN